MSKIITRSLEDLEMEPPIALISVTLVKLLTSHQRWFEGKPLVRHPAYRVLESLLKDEDVRQFLQVNRYNDILWFNKEAFDELLSWLMLVAVIEISHPPQCSVEDALRELEKCDEILKILKEAEKRSDYQRDMESLPVCDWELCETGQATSDSREHIAPPRFQINRGNELVGYLHAP